jgi:PEP-CTERM motif
MLRRILASVVFVALAAGQARGGFILDISGVTTTGSTYPDGTPIPTGTSFDVKAVFSSTPNSTSSMNGNDFGFYNPVSSVMATVNGTTYSDPVPQFYYVLLASPSGMGSPGFGYNYLVDLTNTITNSAFASGYDTATNSFNGAAAAPTVFSGYSGSFPPIDSSLTMGVAPNGLTLTYDPAVGVSASIAGVPEPASHILLLLGLSGAGIALVRRRRAAALA